MLVLSRRVGEDICLPDLDVTIHVLKSKGGRVAIGVDAPREAKVLRGELKPQVAGDSYRTVERSRSGPAAIRGV